MSNATTIKAMTLVPRFHLVHIILHSDDYNMHVEGLVPANL